MIWVQKTDGSESDQMVFEKVKSTYSDAYLCQKMSFHSKKLMKRLKRPTLVSLQGDVRSFVLKMQKNYNNLVGKLWILPF